MSDPASTAPAGKDRLFAPTSAPDTAAAPLPDGKLDLDGILTTKTGAIYFGQIKEEDGGRVVVTVPTSAGKVRTVRPISRDQITSVKELGKADLLKLAKLGPHVLDKRDVERLVAGSTKADAPADEKSKDAPARPEAAGTEKS